MQGAIDVLAEFEVPARGARSSRPTAPRRDVRLRQQRRRARAAGDHRGRRRRGAPARHDRVDDPAAGDRRAGPARSTSTGSTRCSRSCRCPRASRSRRSRSATPATRACSRSASSPPADPELLRPHGAIPGRPRGDDGREGRRGAQGARRRLSPSRDVEPRLGFVDALHDPCGLSERQHLAGQFVEVALTRGACSEPALCSSGIPWSSRRSTRSPTQPPRLSVVSGSSAKRA